MYMDIQFCLDNTLDLDFLEKVLSDLGFPLIHNTIFS